MNKFCVSILTYTAIEHAKRCVSTVLSHSKDVHLILTANGSPEAGAYFRGLAAVNQNVTVVEHPKNTGFWQPNNHAFTLCKSPYFVMLNDDAIPPAGWLDRLVAPLEADEKGALSGPDDGCCSLHDSFHGFRGAAREYVEGSCMMVKSSVAWAHGLFEPMPGLAYGEDSSLSLRYRELGYNLHWVPLRVPHVRAATSKHIPEVRKWQALNHAWARNRFAHYLATRKMNQTNAVIIRRSNAIGDVLLVTPVIRALKEQKPERKIYVETMHPDIFHNNKDVEGANRRIANIRDAHRINLDNSYESEPDRHFVHTYAARCGVTLKSTKTFLFPSGGDREWSARMIQGADWVAIHPGPSTWPGKDWGKPRFRHLIGLIKHLGFKVVLVGSRDPENLGQDLDMRGKTNIQQTAALMERVVCFVGIDSFPIHCAQAMGTPVVGVFGITSPEHILTDGSPAIPVTSDPKHPATGLRHKLKNKTSVSHKDNPMDTVSVEMVFEAFKLLAVKKEAVAQ